MEDVDNSGPRMALCPICQGAGVVDAHDPDDVFASVYCFECGGTGEEK